MVKHSRIGALMIVVGVVLMVLGTFVLVDRAHATVGDLDADDDPSMLATLDVHFTQGMITYGEHDEYKIYMNLPLIGIGVFVAGIGVGFYWRENRP
jgi:hypothetical protein